MSAASALTSSSFTVGAKRIPPFTGTRWWLCWARFREHASRRRLVASAAVTLALATVAVGVALGFAGQYKHFREHNPALLDRLEKRLSFC